MIVINLNGQPFPALQPGDIYVQCERGVDHPVYPVERWDGEELTSLETFPDCMSAVTFCLRLNRYLVVGIYADNSQRYADTIEALDPAEAVAVAEQKGVEVAGVFEYQGNLVRPEAVA